MFQRTNEDKWPNNMMLAQWPAEGRGTQYNSTQKLSAGCIVVLTTQICSFFFFKDSINNCFLSYLVGVLVSMRMKIWARSRRPNVSARGGWPTTLANAFVCGTSTRLSRSWVTCVSCTWRVRSPRPSCWCCTRRWQWSSAWNNKSEVSHYYCTIRSLLYYYHIQWPQWQQMFFFVWTNALS